MNSKKQSNKQTSNQKIEGPQSVAQVFSIARDVNVQNPYHIDGDIDMYSQQNIKIRQNLRKDKNIISQIQQIVKIYPVNSEGNISPQIYKDYQSKIALILRPSIQEDQLKFIVEKDWELDSKQFGGKHMTKQKLQDAIFQLVDVWAIGNTKEQYLSFCRLLKKKLLRVVKTI